MLLNYEVLFLVLSRVQIDLKETVIQLLCCSSDYTHQYFVRLRVQRLAQLRMYAKSDLTWAIKQQHQVLR